MVPSMPLLILRMQPSLTVRNQMCSVRTLNLLFLAPVFNTSRTNVHVSRKTLHRDTLTFINVNISSEKMPESLVNGTSEEVWTLNTPLAQSDPEVRDLYSGFSFWDFFIFTFRWKASSRMKKQGKGLAWRWLLARTLHPFRYCPFVCFLLLACLFVCYFWLVCLVCRGS